LEFDFLTKNMPNFKELLRISFIYSWFSPMFFNILLAIVKVLVSTKDYTSNINLYFYVSVASFVLFLIFLFVVLVKVIKIAESKKLLQIFVFGFLFTFFTIAIFAFFIPILNYIYEIDLIGYVLKS
jgi:hypothetical protein